MYEVVYTGQFRKSLTRVLFLIYSERNYKHRKLQHLKLKPSVRKNGQRQFFYQTALADLSEPSDFMALRATLKNALFRWKSS